MGRRGPPTVNLRDRLTRLEEEAGTLRRYVYTGPAERRDQTVGDLDEEVAGALSGAQLLLDELVVFMDKAAWVLAQMDAILARTAELRSARERLLERWPWSRGTGQSLVGSTIDSPQSYTPRLLPSLESLDDDSGT